MHVNTSRAKLCAAVGCVLASSSLATASETMPYDLVAALAGTPLVEEAGGLPGVTDFDVAVNVTIAITLEGGVADLDGDGWITYADTLLTVDTILARSLGDVDADGSVTTDDIELVEQEANNPGSPVADANFDATVDDNDVALVGDRLDTETAIPPEAVVRTTDMVNYLRLFPAEDLLLAVALLPHDDVPHHQVISEGRPPEGDGPDEHYWYASSLYPRNHLYSVTVTWGPAPGEDSPPIHALAISEQNWPPNHRLHASATWGGNHTTTVSKRWEYAPNHLASVSNTWPPPAGHDPVLSNRWPPNHEVAHSDRKEPTPHNDIMSDRWGHDATTSNASPDPDDWPHGVTISNQWPTNHEPMLSKVNWPQGHDPATSATWPSGHASTISIEWPPQTRPDWPPNHRTSKSDGWGKPTGPANWPIFPPDHSWLITATDVAGAIPTPAPAPAAGG